MGMAMYIKKFFAVLVLVCVVISCDTPTDDTDNSNNNSNGGDVAKTGKVTFFNESSYNVKVHRDSFSGPVLTELSAGQSKKIDVRVSDSQSFGTTFSIEYLYRINDAFDTESGEVIASGLDFNVQINPFVIVEDKSYTVQIPQPTNLEFRSAFIKLLNSYNLPIELRDHGKILQQTGNSTYPIAPGKTGVYKLEGIPIEGETVEGYQVVITLDSTPVPDFTAKNGFIYSFTYNGTSVEKTGEQSITFK